MSDLRERVTAALRAIERRAATVKNGKVRMALEGAANRVREALGDAA